MNTSELLEQISFAENKTQLAALGQTTDALNGLSKEVLSKNDPLEADLLQRALKNYNEFADKKTDPFIVYYKNYLPPPFLIPEIDLTLNVQDSFVEVTTHLDVKKNSDASYLALDGIGHKVLHVWIDEKEIPRSQYRVTPNELIITDLPDGDTFLVTVVSEIDPYHNDALEGLYASGPFLTTQCESEGARRIFFTLDRPDVLSKITTTIIADAKKYPQRLSNGNLRLDEEFEGDVRKITWEDPIPKPSYLYACVLGDFDVLQDHFRTRSGRDVSLEVFVEKGKKERATYSLYALKKSMEFDERYFDREYDLDSLKMVGVPDFNSGAMENKGLLIFNDRALLVDPHSGTDSNFRTVAIVVAHEYFHNWSGNRVTVRNWFELALKEGFTDFRSMLFGEWLYGSAFIRPKDVTALREGQFPEEYSAGGHPIMVGSYVNARSIYDSTTYVKGREVFRTLQTFLDMEMKDGFRKAQNLYYERYDGQAVTFRELLTSAADTLREETGKEMSQFERWFMQQGTPRVKASLENGVLTVSQSCIHPKTGKEQPPLMIPFSYELLKTDGSVFQEKKTTILEEKTHHFEIETKEKLIPIFMHGYSAPVILEYPYTLSELATLFLHSTDPYTQWEAGKNYSLLALQEKKGYVENYKKALQSKKMPILAKAQLLQLPSIRAYSQKYHRFDFAVLQKEREAMSLLIAKECREELKAQLAAYRGPEHYEPSAEQMQVREYRKACLNLLSYLGDLKEIRDLYFSADNFDSAFAAFAILVNRESEYTQEVIQDFYNRYSDDKMVLNHWFAVQAGSSKASAFTIKQLMQSKGYDRKNPNHIRSVLRTFIANLPCYHDAKGEGYAWIVDQIIEVSAFNPMIAHNNLAMPAFIDYESMPKEQKALMARELKRLLNADVPPETREMAKNLLN